MCVIQAFLKFSLHVVNIWHARVLFFDIIVSVITNDNVKTTVLCTYIVVI